MDTAFSDELRKPIKSEMLVSLTKKVLIEAVKFGLEEGGQRVCGPIAWQFFKKIIEPVTAEIKKKYPDVFSLDQQVADKAAKDLSENEELRRLLSSEFDRLWAEQKDNQQEIIIVLERQGRMLEEIKDATDQAAKTSLQQFTSLDIKMDQVLQALQTVPMLSALPLPDIKHQAYALQYDAKRWLWAGDLTIARSRLAEARRLIKDGISQKSDDTYLMALRGYVEMTESDIYTTENDLNSAFYFFEEAIRYFASALKLNPEDTNALNGMVDVYIYLKEYDQAIELGRMVVQEKPDYGAALWDLAFALKEKLDQAGKDTKLMQELADIYLRLINLIPTQPMIFGPQEFKRIQDGLATLREDGVYPNVSPLK